MVDGGTDHLCLRGELQRRRVDDDDARDHDQAVEQAGGAARVDDRVRVAACQVARVQEGEPGRLPVQDLIEVDASGQHLGEARGGGVAIGP